LKPNPKYGALLKNMGMFFLCLTGNISAAIIIAGHVDKSPLSFIRH